MHNVFSLLFDTTFTSVFKKNILDSRIAELLLPLTLCFSIHVCVLAQFFYLLGLGLGLCVCNDRKAVNAQLSEL